MSEPQDLHRARLQSAVVALKKLQAQVDAADRAQREPIAILGAGCRIPGGVDGPEAYWRLLCDGVDTAGELPADRWDAAPLLDEAPYTPGKMFTRSGNYLRDIAGFDPQFFGIAPREALSLDPQQRLLLEVSWEALENAALAPDQLSGSQTGVFVGMSVDDYAQFHLRSGNLADIDAYTCSGAGLCFGAGRISYVLGLHGPCMNIDTACASALTAVHLACQSLRSRECDLALAGGINLILTPEVAVGMSALRALSPDGRCKAFDAAADGFGRGEGCAMVTLKRLSDAVAAGDPILAVILGSSINHDGPSGGLMVPNGLAQEALLRDALARAAVQPQEVQYIEAHGTGTALGDPIELEALQAALGAGRTPENPLLVGSVKTNIGHLEAASGVAGLLKVALALDRREIPPHLHFATPSPHIPWERMAVEVPTQRRPWPEPRARRVAGVSAFGMSGTNVHVVVGEAPPMSVPVSVSEPAPERPLHLLRLSAKTPQALLEMASQWSEFLRERPEADFADVCFTANTGRAQFAHRLTVVAGDSAEAQQKLAAYGRGEEATGVASRRTERSERPKVAFLFTGQGGQYVGMGRRLYETQPTFRAALEQCDEILRPLLERPLLSVLYPPPGEVSPIDETAYTQPALFALEYALAELWRAWGVQPAAALGHSIGEYAAACAAGMLGLEDGLRLVAARGRLMQALPPDGAMAAVFVGEAQAMAAIRPYPAELSIAAVNGPAETVLSGSAERLEQVLAEFEASGVKAKRLSVSHAFHSPRIEPMLDEFQRLAAGVRYQEPRFPVLSNLTGAELRPAELEGGDYWRRHARGTVRFMAGVEALHAQGFGIFVEAGPRPSLAGLGRQVLPDAPALWLASLRKDQDDWKPLLASLSALHLHGVPVDWRGFDRGYPRRRLALPTYPFQRTRFWTERARPASAATGAAAETGALHPLVQRRVALPLREKVFESVLRADAPSYLAEHGVRGTAVLPGTAYLEMALEGARQVWGEGAHALESVRFREPLVFREGQAETVQLVLTPDGDGEMRFEIRRRAGDEDWRLHALGRVKAGEPFAPAAPQSIEALQALCPEEIAPEDYYERFRRRGLEYGPAFRALQSLRRAPGEAVARVELRQQQAAEAESHHCHPCLLDAALQAMAAGVDDAFADQGAGIPIGVERYCVYRKPQGPVWSHSVVRRNPDGSGVAGDAQLLDDSGELLVEVQGLRVQQVRDQASAVPATDSRRALYETVWREQALPAAGDGERSWAIVGEGDGLAARLAATLEASGDRCSRLGAEQAAEAGCSDVVSLQALDAGSALEVCAEALTLVQALGDRPSPPRLWLVTRGAQTTGAEEVPPSVEQAALWGFGATVASESPELRCTRVDLDPAADADLASTLAAELRSASAEDRIAWRGGVRWVERLVPRAKAAEAGAVRLQQTQPGVLSGLAFRPVERVAPGPGQIEIRVRATGLNFRDVLNALGLYPGEAGPLGDEGSGTVVAVGAGVEGVRLGDEVIALASGSFATFVTTEAAFAVKRPASLTAEVGAGVPIAFLTALYGLRTLARVQPRERVLIHAAAGGVGLAAVRIAQRLGAEVFATAGSPEKRAFLQAQGVRHVFDSRSTAFGDEILAVTGGAGVQAVLNSLGPEHIRRSLEILPPGGRFVEIGKRDILTTAEAAAVNPAAEYTAFQLGELMQAQPALVGELLEEIVSDLSEGRLEPLPQRNFAAGRAADAFRFMAQARQIGKLVVQAQVAEPPRIQPDATYLITGGLGALGLHAARRLAARGARHLALVGRRGPGAEAEAAIEKLRAAGVDVRVFSADVAVRAEMEAVLAAIDAGPAPLRGVLHTAGVLDDGLLPQQTRERFAQTLAPKTLGARWLDELTRDRRLDFFVLYSSIVALAGTKGQSAYAAANAYLDALAHARQAQGLPALSVNWGAWAEAGMAARVSARDRRRWAEQGIAMIEPEQGMAALEELLAAGVAQAAVLPIDWVRFLGQYTEPLQAPPLYAELRRSKVSANPQGTAKSAAPTLLDELRREALPQKRRQRLEGFVRGRVAQVLGLGAGEAIDGAQPIRELGLDSLMAVEIRNALGAPFGEALPVSLLYDYPTVEALTDYLSQRFAEPEEPAAPSEPAAEAAAEAGVPSPDRALVEQASEDEAEALLLKELEALNF
ncbi:MAG: SDR family NAD(P)-dependent oxidoreductase [Acidobacteria bacterium]|nr:SDR family NAD(P)-dependent oxidoreductase [Acidobacteriota bacterium]